MMAVRDRMSDHVMRTHDPTFTIIDKLRLDEVDTPVDVVWSHSLVTHLPEDGLVELFEHVSNIFAEDGQAFFSFFDKPRQSSMDYGYSIVDLNRITADLPIHLQVYGDDVYRSKKGTACCQSVNLARLTGWRRLAT
jgi:hypothetical protein